MRATLSLLLIGALTASALGQDKTVTVPVTADVGVSSVVGKMTFSNGTGPTTPIMQNQNWSGFENKNLLMAFDTKAIRGWTVKRATMHLWLAKGDLWGTGLCTVLSDDWREGGALNYVVVEGAPCWKYIRTPAEGAKPGPANWWAWPGSRFFSVSWSHPAARYSHAGAAQIQHKKSKDGRFLRLSFPVDPKLVECLAAGVAGGLVLTDDKGQVRESYSLIGPGTPYRYNAAEEAWMFTRDVQDPAFRPVLEVVGGPIDKTPPAAPKGLKVAEVSPSDGSVVVTFTAPGDDGAKGDILAYEVTAAGKRLPLWSMPKPVAAGQMQRLPIFTLPPGQHAVAIRAVDEAGNRGQAGKIAVTIPAPPPATLAKARPWAPRRLRKRVGDAKLQVHAVPDLAKVDPISGAVLTGDPKAPKDYFRTNPVAAGGGQAVLTAAANEVVAFQAILKRAAGKLTKVRVAVSDLAGRGGKTIPADPNVQTFRLWYVKAGAPRRGRGRAGWYGTACLPLKKPFDETFDLPAGDNKVPNQAYQSVWVDVYVPRGTAAGDYEGSLTVAAAELAKPLSLPIRLRVLPLALPDTFSYISELNRYHSVVGWAGVNARRDPAQALKTMWDYYRLAHQHRCVLNVLPYSHSSRMDGDYLPKMSGTGTATRIAGWADWDQRFGPLLDGSAFTAKNGYVGPGAGVPLNHMYLPFHEGWPIPINATTYKDWMAVGNRLQFAEYAKKARRPHEAFTDAYKKAHIAVAKQFFAHAAEKGYTRTAFHLYNNNKYYWKATFFGAAGGRGGVSFWLMDEPTDFDDYDANAFIMSLGLAGWRAADAAKVRAAGRTDVSQPDMARGLWDNVAGVWCIGGLRGYSTTTAARRRWMPDEHHWCYGGGVGIPGAAVGMCRSFLLRWCIGLEGQMPWWNCFGGHAGAWRRAENLAVYYTGVKYAGGSKNYPGPIAGVRMKYARRSQQDVEYLHLLARCRGWDRLRVRAALAKFADDPTAPLLRFDKLTDEKMNEIRRRVAVTVLGAISVRY